MIQGSTILATYKLQTFFVSPKESSVLSINQASISTSLEIPFNLTFSFKVGWGTILLYTSKLITVTSEPASNNAFTCTSSTRHGSRTLKLLLLAWDNCWQVLLIFWLHLCICLGVNLSTKLELSLRVRALGVCLSLSNSLNWNSFGY